eukprot:scaffold88600_cov29-Tisochrysis_lutea.AAC.1
MVGNTIPSRVYSASHLQRSVAFRACLLARLQPTTNTLAAERVVARREDRVHTERSEQVVGKRATGTCLLADGAGEIDERLGELGLVECAEDGPARRAMRLRRPWAQHPAGMDGGARISSLSRLGTLFSLDPTACVDAHAGDSANPLGAASTASR